MSLRDWRLIEVGQVFPRGVVRVSFLRYCRENSTRAHDEDPPRLCLHLPCWKKLKSVGGGSKRILADRQMLLEGWSSLTQTTLPNLPKKLLTSHGLTFVGKGLITMVVLKWELHAAGKGTAVWRGRSGNLSEDGHEVTTGPGRRPEWICSLSFREDFVFLGIAGRATTLSCCI